jgi:hypothetical protein
MTRVTINPGSCGFLATVEVEKQEGKSFKVTIQTECTMGQKFASEIREVALHDVLKRFLQNPVYLKGTSCIHHSACPVPSGVLKALEVEAGLNVPKDVTITFVKEEKKRDPAE